ncbi:MAG TPA: hypothetical protein VF100_08390, partial [Thermoanaerobaculia bacterium]
FEPRSLTAGRAFFRQAYGQAFRGADCVLLAPVFYAGRFEKSDLLDRAVALARPGDVFVTMSSGSFEGVPERLLERLGER